MTKLKKIQKTAQHAVSAIAAAFGADVALIDNDFNLVATSKTFLEKKGTLINRGYVRKIFERGSIVVTNPGHNEFCRGCECEGRCPQTAEVDRAIVYEEEIIGVILMVAYTSEQRDKLLNNTTELLRFLGEMAKLLCNEIKLQETLRLEKIVKSHLETTIKYVEGGIITVNRTGSITQINDRAAEVLKVPRAYALGMNLQDILAHEGIADLLERGEAIEEQEFLSGGARPIHCLLSANPASVHGKVAGAVINIKDMRKVRSTVYELSEKHMACTFDDIHGESPAMRKVKAEAGKMAATDSTVLIHGESGTGKELFARAIHSGGKRSRNPFIAINCAAIPETLLESELFGYDEGAFSGARKGGKPGKFERAGGGTVFLDEIGDMPLHMQVKLLRVLQEHTIERVGGLKTIPIDVRIIAATHRDLAQMVKDGKFREDLYFRLNVLPLHVPPLRRRKSDIAQLGEVFLEKYNRKIGKEIDAVGEEAMAALSAYYWPGNVRELENTVEYAVNMETGKVIGMDSIPSGIGKMSGIRHEGGSLGARLREYEKLLIQETLESSGRTLAGKKMAAGELGVSLPTLYRRIKELRI